MTFLQEHLLGRPDRTRRVFELAGINFSNGKLQGKEFRTLCGLHADKNNPSLDVWIDGAVFDCRTCGEKGDAVCYYAKFKGMAIEDAIAELRRILDLPNDNGRSEPEPTVLKVRSWPIPFAVGEGFAIHHRKDLSNGKKKIWWEYQEKPSLNKRPVADLALYCPKKLTDADPGAPVLLAEGEPKADALIEHGFIAVATVTGASETPGPAALEVLRGRHVILWPDFDEPGRRHMDKISKALAGVAASVRLLRWGEQLTDDAVDFFARGGTTEQLDHLLEDATEAPPPATEPEKEDGGSSTTAEAATTEPEDDDFTVSFADWKAHPAPPCEYVVGGLIAKPSVNALIGRPYGGKSLSTMNRGLCIVSGKEAWNDFKIPKPIGAYLYVDEEMGRPLMEGRMLRMLAMVPEFDPALFRIASRKGLRLDDAKWQERIRRVIDKHKVRYAAWDTLRRLHSGNEDRSEEMAPLLAFFALLMREHGVTIEFLHHTKKNVDEGASWMDAARGSGDIVAGTDAMLGIWKKNETAFSFRADSKHAGEISPIDLLLDPEHQWLKVPGEAEKAAMNAEIDESKIQEAMARLYKSLRRMRDTGQTPTSWSAWLDKTEGNSKTLAQARDRMAAEGGIHLRGKKWVLVEKGDES